MAGDVIRRFAPRLVLIAILFGNAIAPGVCAAVCDLGDFWPQVAVEPPQCDKCVGENANPEPEPDHCCEWIGKRVDLPANLATSFKLTQQSALAVPTAAIEFLVPTHIGRAWNPVVPQDRAPPDPLPAIPHLRGPPMI